MQQLQYEALTKILRDRAAIEVKVLPEEQQVYAPATKVLESDKDGSESSHDGTIIRLRAFLQSLGAMTALLALLGDEEAKAVLTSIALVVVALDTAEAVANASAAVQTQATARKNLTAEQRTQIIQASASGMTSTAIARTMGIPAGTVRVVLSRHKSQLAS